MSLRFEVGTYGYERAVNSLRRELNFLDESDAFAMMAYNVKVIAQLGPGDHWLLRRVTEEDLKGGPSRSAVTSGTIEDILKSFVREPDA